MYVEWFSLEEWDEGQDFLHIGVDPGAKLEENIPAFLLVLIIQGENGCLQGPEHRPGVEQPSLETQHAKLVPLLNVPEVVGQQVAGEPVPNGEGDILSEGEGGEEDDGEDAHHLAGHVVVHLQLPAAQGGEGEARQAQLNQDCHQIFEVNNKLLQADGKDAEHFEGVRHLVPEGVLEALQIHGVPPHNVPQDTGRQQLALDDWLDVRGYGCVW